VRIEHLGNVVASPDDVAIWRRAGVRPVLQPAFLHNFVADYVPMLLGDAGMTGRLPLRSILDRGSCRPRARTSASGRSRSSRTLCSVSTA
jgi:predicted amidohydrolase YtcJ